MTRLWRAGGGGEVLYESDMPSCCRRNAFGEEDGAFDCPTCGADWVDGFATRGEED